MRSPTASAEQKPRAASLGQRRANHAWKAARNLMNGSEFSEAQQKDYAGEAKKLPIRIKASGLGQALAFIHAKSKKSKTSLARLHEDLSEWVLAERGLRWTQGDPDWKPSGSATVLTDQDGNPQPKLLLEAVVYGTTDFLRWATDETLTYLQWLNRFLEAQIDPEDSNSE